MKNKILLVLILFLAAILRLYKLDSIPPSLYWDEVSLGYNAYSILTSGIDEHGEFLPYSRFIAFGDYKPPGYIYFTVPSILIFDLNEFAVRFPSAISGIILSAFTYLISKQLFKKTHIALLSALILAMSPWSLQLSRGAFEANLACLFNAVGIYFFLKFDKNNGKYLLVSVIFFVLSFYTFNANRIIAPLILISFSLLKIKIIINIKKWFVISVIVGIILALPSVSFLRSRESKIRFQEVSIFNKLEILINSNKRIESHNNSQIFKIIDNRRIAYAKEFLVHYFDHLRFDFLFINGDVNPRLSSQQIGMLYLIELPFLLIGIFYTIWKLKKDSLFLFLWLLIVIIPAAVAKETPHALRTVSILPIYQIFIAYGIYISYCWLNENWKKECFRLILSFLLIFNFFYYIHHYYIHYPVEWANEWQYGYKEAVEKIAELSKDYNYILVTESLGRPYIYFLFYNKVDPKFFLTTRIADRDWFGFWKISGYDKFRFGLEQQKFLKGKVLFVGNEEDTAAYTSTVATVKSPSSQTVFRFVTLNL